MPPKQPPVDINDARSTIARLSAKATNSPLAQKVLGLLDDLLTQIDDKYGADLSSPEAIEAAAVIDDAKEALSQILFDGSGLATKAITAYKRLLVLRRRLG